MAPPAEREANATQRGARQSPYKMRLVIDEIRGKMVNEALAYLAFSKKHAAVQIEKTLRSAKSRRWAWRMVVLLVAYSTWPGSRHAARC